MPLADILQFRNEHAQQLLGLRTWASDVANGQLAGYEIQEKLEYLTGEYDEQLRLLRKAKARGRIEIVVTTIAEVVEELARFRFGAAAKAVASIRHESANLMLQERQLVGREVSYVVDARGAFGAKGPGA